MDVDPRLQNLGPVDIHDFQFGPAATYDPNYPAAVYAHGLNTSGGPAVHPHPHTQAHFVQDGQGGYFTAAAPPPQPQRQPSQSQGQPQPPSQQQQQQQQPQRVQQVRRPQGRGAVQRSRLPSTQNVNLSTSIDPNLRGAGGGGGSVGGTTGGVNVSNNPQNRRGRLASHPAARNQQSQVPHGQFIAQFTPPASVQQTSTAQQSPTIRQQPSGAAATTTATTPTAASRKAPSSIQVHFTSNIQPQGAVQTPASSSTPKTASVQTPNATDQLTVFNPPSTFEFVPNPPNLAEWRHRFFNITEPILLTSEQYHTYFPHVDNIYSHRSTQRYKKKPFVSHYWDCRLKGRPTGTPLSKSKSGVAGGAGGLDDDRDEAKEKKKRKRKTRERDLCDVKIKVTEFFGRDELEALGRLGIAEDDNDPLSASSIAGANGQLTFVLEDGTTATAPVNNSGGQSGLGQDVNMPFGVLEPLKRFPADHPGAEGKRWYMVQRVNGSGKEGEVADETNLDHKHTLEESDRIKKNSVQRWLLAQEKEKKKQVQRSKNPTSTDQSEPSPTASRNSGSTANSVYLASGAARNTAKSHSLPAPSQITFYANSFCPFAQRIWIALELKQIAYQYVEVPPNQIKDGKCTLPNLLEVNPEGIIPCIRHGNWAIWESTVVLEYLEDLSMGLPMLPLGAPQLRAHCRLWTDHINRKILPFFYSLLLLPQYLGRSLGRTDGTSPDVARVTAEHKSTLISRLQSAITDLVNASHATGPFFLGTDISYVDIIFAPWIIRLSRVLSYYREFPRPEVGTRWYTWVNAVEENECVKRTVSEDRSYHNVYGGVGRDGCDSVNSLGLQTRPFVELMFARQVILQTGFGLGGDLLGHLVPGDNSMGVHL